MFISECVFFIQIINLVILMFYKHLKLDDALSITYVM